MTITKNAQGELAITLSDEETRQFELGTPIITQETAKNGIIDVELRKRVSCPSGHTRAFLRDMCRPKPSLATETTVRDLLEGYSFRPDQNAIKEDLRRFAKSVAPGDTHIGDIMYG